jgi:hypothetical protein
VQVENVAGRREASDEETLVATERWFLRRGIPHFIEDYSAGEDVFTRATPVLGLVFIVEMLGAVNLDWPWWANAAAIPGAVAVVAAGWALVNRLRDEPTWQLPTHVGTVELAAFVVLPALLPLVFGGQVRSALATAAGNLLLLAIVYLVTSYGLFAMTRWALGQTIRQLGAVTGLLGRALPLLLLFSVTLFINTEVWQVASTLDGTLLAATISVFVVVGTLFLFSRLPGELRALAARGPVVEECCAGTPLEAAAPGLAAGARLPPLSRRQRGNVLLVLLFSQAVQVVLVSLVMGLFFLVLGMLTIRPEVVATWLGDLGPPTELASVRVAGHDFVLSRALFNVAGFLSGFAGFYFTVYAVIDPTYREQFFDGIVAEVRQAMGVRAAYLALRSG